MRGAQISTHWEARKLQQPKSLTSEVWLWGSGSWSLGFFGFRVQRSELRFGGFGHQAPRVV